MSRPRLGLSGTAALIALSGASLLVVALIASRPWVAPEANEPSPTETIATPHAQAHTGNVEYLGSRSSEWTERTARYDECMKSDGWAFRDGPSGAVFGFPEDQWDAFAEADRRCNEESGRADVAAGGAQTEVDLATGYAEMLELAACLRQLGFALSPEPSLQAFIDGGATWSPYLDVSDTDAPDALRSCPQPLG